MSIEAELLKNVTFDDSAITRTPHLHELYFDSELGFLVTDSPETGKPESLLGFMAGRETLRLVREEPLIGCSITTLDEMPEDERNIDTVGKGVGARLLSNGLQALAASPKPTLTCGVYEVPLLGNGEIVDMRQPTDSTVIGKLMRIARHAGRIIGAYSIGLEEEVKIIHNKIAERAENSSNIVGAVYNQAPRTALRQWMRGIPRQNGIQPAFLVIRNQAPIREIGSFTIDKEDLTFLGRVQSTNYRGQS